MDIWKKLEPLEYDEVWDRFYKRFRFKPSTHSPDWPGIVEPADSVTYYIGHVYDGDAVAYGRRTQDLRKKFVEAFRTVCPMGEAIYALDWQHTCYWLDPHGKLDFEKEEDWPVPALPNGDYYIFLTRDMKCGVFGHPWERTMCVFGRDLVDAVEAQPPELFANKVRVAGRAV